jgi:hypothetical protein
MRPKQKFLRKSGSHILISLIIKSTCKPALFLPRDLHLLREHQRKSTHFCCFADLLTSLPPRFPLPGSVREVVESKDFHGGFGITVSLFGLALSIW